MKLTIFTPVYNRKKLLTNLYESLCEQTCREFVWLIIDDGSTDGTQEQVAQWTIEFPFEIKYVFQNNHGKHTAHNKAISLCETDLFLCVDSDDRLFNDAVEQILKVNEEYSEKEILGFFFRKVDICGMVSGGDFKPSQNIVGLRDLYHQNDFRGELAIVLKTKYAQRSEFPIFEGEYFVSELVYYNELNDIAPMVWIDKIIYEFEYQDTGYSKNSARLVAKNPYGTACGYLSEAHYSSGVVMKTKAYAEYLAICFVFDLDKQKLPNWLVDRTTMLLSRFILFHYLHIFEKIKTEKDEDS